jgi:hypothetical protein
MSLDAAEVDLSRSFVFGQGYVALSRVRSLAGLKVLGLNPNALMVDPKIITQDSRFHAESEAAEETFLALDEKELADMHARFVKSGGGVLPSSAAVESAAGKTAAERVSAESTYEQTLRALASGLSLPDLAKTRGLAVSTIVSHLEYLAEAGKLTETLMQPVLASYPEYIEAKPVITAALMAHGSDKLKPLYEATEGKYDYILIRLVRVMYELEQTQV